jgi:hypothetical protein
MGTVLGAPIVRDSVRGVVPNVEPHELCLTGDALRVALYGLRFRADSVQPFSKQSKWLVITLPNPVNCTRNTI